MPEKSKLRKRLLYDLTPIPEVPVNKNVTGKLEPEIRVVYDKRILLDLQKIKKSFKVGSENVADCVVDETYVPEQAYEFATVSGTQFSINLKENLKGVIYKGDEKTDLTEYVAKKGNTVDIDESTLLIVEFGKISICAMKSQMEPFKSSGFLKQFDAVLGIIMLLSFLIGGFIVNMIIETPPIEVDIFELDNRFAKLIVGEEQDVKVEELEEEKKVKLEKPKEGLVEASQQRKSLGEEGRVGDKKSRVANAQGSARRGLDAKVAQSSGIMGALSSGAANFDRVFGGGGLGAGMEKTLGSVTGLAGVDQFGSGGLGTRGFGTGGGGNALGIGGLGTRGRGGGGGGKYGMAAGQIGRKGRSDITAGGGQAVIMGALDRSVIDAYIKRNLAKIRWCYEKELNKDPKLFGRIVINFIISGTGTVSSSKVNRTTMGNQNVESCVADQIKKIRFPAPKGGGIVIVNYPFVFKHSEG
ncbi:MAG TPA: AgmX/PglI C-terminal domain-containing protein [bacterium]|nr:AgmX/PglI C-terminal domain-containing protein [bacterium]